VLGQVKVADKSNEIVAIPKLLEMLAIEGAIVTIDAMGCQRDIAQKIIDKKADYVLALKGNQGTLREDVELFVAEQKSNQFKDTTISRSETVDDDHGRIETRTTTVVHDFAWLQERHDWPGMKAVVIVDSSREIGDKIEHETRFYITSLVLLANLVGPIVRSHWASRTACIGSWTWSFETMNAASEPSMRQPTSPPSSIWPTTSSEMRQARTPCASDERSPRGTTTSSQI
jgi:predicted transposase YbfD/YdcC